MKQSPQILIPGIRSTWWSVAFWLLFSLTSDSCLAAESEVVRFPIPRAPRYLTVPGKIAGREYRFVFDTGFSDNALDTSLRELTEGEAGEVVAGGVTGPRDNVTMKRFHLPAIQIGSISVPKSVGILFGTRFFGETIGEELGGVVGLSNVAGAKFYLDYQARQLAWHRGDWLLHGPGVSEVEIKVIFGVPRVKLSLDGRTVPFAIDTGSNSCVMLQTEAFDVFVADGIIEVNPVRGRAQGALATRGQSRQGWFLKGELMGKGLRGVSVVEAAGVNILGLGWWGGFTSEIDGAGGKLRYRVVPNAAPPISYQLTLGAILIHEQGRARVFGLIPSGQGAAERAGLQADDVIEEFGPLGRGKVMGDALLDVLAEKTGTAVTVKVYRPSEMRRFEVTLALPAIVSMWDFAGRAKP